MTKKKRVRIWRPESQPSQSPAGDSATRQVPASAALVETSASLETMVDELRARFASRETESLGGLFKDIASATLDKAKAHFNADRTLQHVMSGFIEAAASRYALDPGEQWRPGEPLKVLLAGYTGSRNTGADVRVEEMIRQFRHLFGDEHIELSIFTIEPELTRGYFPTVRQLHLPKLFPKFLFDTIHRQHAVVACEGSMFKSKFANALSTMMVGAMGLAAAEGKLAVGYGGEAGKMDESLAELVRTYCQDALVIARNDNSREVLAELGVASRAGTDTAWTFSPAAPEVGRRILMEAGWNGETPVLALCPINPFWWPVRPNVTRAAVNQFSDLYADSHYGSIYFHKEGTEVEDAQDRYLQAIADATQRFRDQHEVFPILFGSEQLDRYACEALNAKLGGECPVIVSDEHDMYAMVSAMRQSTYMVSSRYHACVMTMAGGVLSAGITMDERIRNLMVDRGTPELALEVDSPNLTEELYGVLTQLVRERETIHQGIDDCVYRNLEKMGGMGQVLVDHVRKHHPEFPFRSGLGQDGDPWEHLPTLGGEVAQLVSRVKARREATLANEARSA